MKLSKTVAVAASASMAVFLAACGGGEAGGGTSAVPADAATGTPIPIALISQENSASGSYPENRENVEAAVEYINSELGGVGGRPLELHSCVTDGSPEKSGTCARELLSKNPLFFVGGVDFGTATSLPILEEAGVSQMGGVPILPADFNSPNVFQFVPGSAGAYPALAEYMVKHAGVKSASIIHADDAAGRAVATTYGKDIFNKLGVTDVTMVAEQPTAADFTAAVTKANEGNPDGILVAQAAAGCTRVMQAVQALGIETPLFYSSACATHEVATAGGPGVEGAYFVNSLDSLDGDSEDVVTYRRVMEKYRPDTAIGGIGAYSFTSMMNAYSVLSGLDVDSATAADVTEAMKAAKDHKSFMGHPFTCDGKQLHEAPSVCTAWQRIWQYKDGKFADASDWINPSGNES